MSTPGGPHRPGSWRRQRNGSDSARRARRPRHRLALTALAVAFSFGGMALAGVGALGPGDEQLVSGEYFDTVTFTGTAGSQVVIELKATEFDPYVIVIDASENVIAEEDDSPGAGLDVHLTVTLPSAGEYTVFVTSSRPGETGRYSLTLSAPQAIAGTAPLPPSTGQPAVPTGTLTPASPRSVTGVALDTQGRPLAGALIRIVPALTTGSVEVRTDANGVYLAEGLLDVPYRIRGWTFVEHGGEQICLRLGMESPVDYDTFVPTMGAVRNFRMQLTGPIEDLRDSKEQFGGLLSVFDAWPYEGAGSRIEFTFTPTGPLVDGSRGEPFTRVVDPDRDTEIRGLPIGPYRVAATLVGSDGSRSPLGVAVDSLAEPTASIEIDWTSDGGCSLTSGVGWEYVYLELPEGW